MSPEFTADDEGKRVIDADGEQIGLIESVTQGEAHVNPDPSVTDTIKSALGWGEADEETYKLDRKNVDTITEDEVRLRRT